jgi:hypothetical protein
LYGKRNSRVRRCPLCAKLAKRFGKRLCVIQSIPHRVGQQGGHETFGAIDRRFCASRWDRGRVWSQCGTAAVTRTRLSPTRVAEHLFAWHGLTGRGTEAA